MGSLWCVLHTHSEFISQTWAGERAYVMNIVASEVFFYGEREKTGGLGQILNTNRYWVPL